MTSALVCLAATWLVLAGCGGNDPEALPALAKTEWSAGRLDEAERALGRLAKVRPLRLNERLLRSQVARDRGRIDEAVAALGTPDDLGNDPAAAAVLESSRGTLELSRHRFVEAEARLLEAIRLDPKRVEARRELINLYGIQGRQVELRAAYQALDGQAPFTFAELYLWTLGRREDVGPGQLAEALGRAVEADPGDRRSRLALAESLRRLGRLDDAETTLATFGEADVEVRVARARVALDRGEDARAESLLKGLEGPAVARLLGRIALERDESADAVRLFRLGFADHLDDRAADFGLGQALRLVGDTTDARRHTDAARDRDRLEWLVQNARTPALRDDPKTLRGIGDACLTVGRPEVARAWYRLALSKNPLDAELQGALKRLQINAKPSPQPAVTP